MPGTIIVGAVVVTFFGLAMAMTPNLRRRPSKRRKSKH